MPMEFAGISVSMPTRESLAARYAPGALAGVVAEAAKRLAA